MVGTGDHGVARVEADALDPDPLPEVEDDPDAERRHHRVERHRLALEGDLVIAVDRALELRSAQDRRRGRGVGRRDRALPLENQRCDVAAAVEEGRADPAAPRRELDAVAGGVGRVEGGAEAAACKDHRIGAVAALLPGVLAAPEDEGPHLGGGRGQRQQETCGGQQPAANLLPQLRSYPREGSARTAHRGPAGRRDAPGGPQARSPGCRQGRLHHSNPAFTVKNIRFARSRRPSSNARRVHCIPVRVTTRYPW